MLVVETRCGQRETAYNELTAPILRDGGSGST